VPSDEQEAEQPLWMGQREVERQVASPRVANRPGALEPEAVEHRDRVRDVRLDRVGRISPGGRRPTLRVTHRHEEAVEHGCALGEVVGNSGAAVQEERRQP